MAGGEDFARYGMTEEGVPIFMFWVGGQPQEVWDEYMARGETPPANHSPFFYPDAETSITMATEGMAAIALDLRPGRSCAPSTTLQRTIRSRI